MSETRTSASIRPFTIPPDLEAKTPIEALGFSRDGVRLMVASAKGGLRHAVFCQLDDYLEPGDLVVVNDSKTLPAALSGRLRGIEIRLHLSTPVPGTRKWLVEPRLSAGPSSSRFTGALSRDTVELAGDGRAVLLAPRQEEGAQARLWEASLHLPDPLPKYLHRWGQPIRYPYVNRAWELQYYQTIFARIPGSAEMPSAARPFSWPLTQRLASKGIDLCFVTLHTGVASLESKEAPFPERYRVNVDAAEKINATRRAGGRVIAVGTTVVRALESARDNEGVIIPSRGFTDLVIRCQHQIRAIDGIITGWHEPEATHFMLLEAVAGPGIVAESYQSALKEGYRWHEFGDSHLILRG